MVIYKDINVQNVIINFIMGYSFGALDTTRIFACQVECSRMQFDLERKIENSANKKFILNRIQGGDITLATHIDKNNRVLS